MSTDPEERRRLIREALEERKQALLRRESLDRITQQWQVRTAHLFNEMAKEALALFPRPKL